MGKIWYVILFVFNRMAFNIIIFLEYGKEKSYTLKDLSATDVLNKISAAAK